MGELKPRNPLSQRAFQILLLLGDGPLHGWSIVKELQAQEANGVRILPGSLYRTLNAMTEQGLIEEAPDLPVTSEDGRRRYLRLTSLGIDMARAEAEHLEELVQTARSKSAFFPKGARV